jgi:hypothetical protein
MSRIFNRIEINIHHGQEIHKLKKFLVIRFVRDCFKTPGGRRTPASAVAHREF